MEPPGKENAHQLPRATSPSHGSEMYKTNLTTHHKMDICLHQQTRGNDLPPDELPSQKAMAVVHEEKCPPQSQTSSMCSQHYQMRYMQRLFQGAVYSKCGIYSRKHGVCMHVHEKVNRSAIKSSYSTLLVLSKCYCRGAVLVQSSYCGPTVLVESSYCRGMVYMAQTMLVYSAKSIVCATLMIPLCYLSSTATLPMVYLCSTLVHFFMMHTVHIKRVVLQLSCE